MTRDAQNGAFGLADLKRVGVIDVGSNSVRLVVFDGAARSPAYFYNEKILCGLGRGVSETGRLHPEGRQRALVAIKRFAMLRDTMALQSLSGVATAAVREAKDGPEFVKDVHKATGLSLQVATGRQEARLSAQGVLLGRPDAHGLVCDIGGSSMEIAVVKNGEVGHCETSPLGPLKLGDFIGDATALQAHMNQIIEGLRQKFPGTVKKLYLVGGSFRAIARLDMERREYPLKVLHEYTVTQAQLRATLNWVDELSLDEMLSLTSTSQERLSLVPLVARVLRVLVEIFSPSQISVSSYGIREGMLFEKMTPQQRSQDPLIEACLAAESVSARFPGFGEALFDWLAPLTINGSPGYERLTRAACLLHDVTWRAHPDYRADACFDNVTRASLGGLDHAGRVYLGVALLHRYKNSIGSSQFSNLTTMLTDEGRIGAEVLGKAMRLGALLGGASKSAMGRILATPDTLTLSLPAQRSDICGEVVEKRLAALAAVMGLQARVDILPASG